MSVINLVSDDDLERARQDPAFRHQLVANNLELLLSEINKMRAVRADAMESPQIREAVSLAVKLAELLQKIAAARGEPLQTSLIGDVKEISGGALRAAS
jgi:hypothetical protein